MPPAATSFTPSGKAAGGFGGAGFGAGAGFGRPFGATNSFRQWSHERTHIGVLGA
jgi:hypothetical protein